MKNENKNRKISFIVGIVLVCVIAYAVASNSTSLSGGRDQMYVLAGAIAGIAVVWFVKSRRR